MEMSELCSQRYGSRKHPFRRWSTQKVMGSVLGIYRLYETRQRRKECTILCLRWAYVYRSRLVSYKRFQL